MTTPTPFITPFQTVFVTYPKVAFSDIGARDFGTIRAAMTDYLPRYYEGVAVSDNILDRDAAVISRLTADISDVLGQFYVNTATWGLARWERIFGITPDETKPSDQRQSVILGKLRGIGTVTVALIESVAESYNNGDVDVAEDNAANTVTISFVSNLGIPANLTDMQAAIRDIVPAHLAIVFEFIFTTWADVDSYALTRADVDALGLTWAEWEKYKP